MSRLTRCLRPLLVGVLLAALFAPGAARADVRDDARRAFKLGMALIAGGDHLEGIEFLEKAYELMPHASVLYNIGLAWADAGDYGQAIAVFERYLASDPGDGAAVERLMALLEDQIAEEAAPPPGSEPPPDRPAVGDGGAVASTPELEALITRLEGLADRLEGKESIEVAPLEDAIEPTALESKEGIFDEVVVSASRQSTTPVDAPAAITIISAEQIRLSGATNLPDLLRRVPGMSTLTMGAGNANLAVRGFNQRLSNKVLVLVDGRSVYLDFLGGTLFRSLSIDLQDIERVEVIRGPGSTLYGANAFGGVVNIITKQPGAGHGGQVHITAGSGDTIMGNARFAGREGILEYRGSIGYEQTNRYELEFGDRSDIIASTEDVELAVRALRANAGIWITPAPKIRLGLSGGASYAYDSFAAIGVLGNYWLQGLNSDLRFDAQLGGLGVRVFWNHMNVTADQTWQKAGGGSSLSTTPQAHVLDVEAVYSGTARTGPVRHDIAVGAGYRLKTIDWSYLDGPHVEQHLHGFLEDRITLVPELVVVAGFRFDQHPLVGFMPSPRGAVLVKPTPGQAIRVSVGTAFRTPTFLESYLDLVIPSGVVTGVGIRSRGSTELSPENNFAVEAGYTFEDSDFVAFGINGWYQRVSDIIALGNIDSGGEPGPLVGSTFVSGTSNFQNADGVFHGLGGEAEVHAFPVDGLDLRANYSFAYWIDQELKDAEAETFRDPRHPMHMANIGASYRSPIGLEVNLDLHIVSDVVIPERTFDAATGNAIYEDCEADPYAMVSARLGQRLLQDRLEFGVTAFNIGGWAKGGHREHCLASRVGPRILGSATYRF
jgi:outer membrane receptor for ferrienterochelin and colicin